MGDEELAAKLVAKMSLEDRRILMCVEGEFKMPVATEPYDQFKVGKVFIKNGASLPVAEVNELATKAMMKRIARGEVSLPDSAKLQRN